VAAAAILVLDQSSKWVALRALQWDGSPVTVIPGVLWFELILNTGAAFGLFQSLGPLLALISVVLIYAGFKIIRHEDDPLLVWSLACILGGASGNLIDRVFRGGVVDFIRIPAWPLFNLADCAITAGTAGVILYALMKRNRNT
jgi:signal peptidase II